MIRLLLLATISLISSLLCYTQEKQQSDNRFNIGFYFSPYGKYTYETFHHEDGAPVISQKNFYSAGIFSLYKVTNFISIGPGISCDYYFFQLKPGEYSFPESQAIWLLEIPFILRFEFLKYFYASQGVLLDFAFGDQGYIGRQAGWGYFMNAGFNYKSKSNWSVFAGPVVNIKNLLPIKREDYSVFQGFAINFGMLIPL